MSKTNEKRKYSRYETAAQVYFEIEYDLETNVKFQMVDPQQNLSRPYPGISRNVSVEGLCFGSNIKLNPGDKLKIEIYLPQASNPISLEGEVCWSKPNTASGNNKFDTGVHLNKVEGKIVSGTIHYDQEYQVYWSDVLESILGKFKEIGKKRTQA